MVADRPLPTSDERRAFCDQGETSMGLVSYVSKDDAAESVRPILEGMERKLGSVPSIFGMMAHNPELLQGFLALNGALAKTKLDGKLRELAYMKASQLNGCEYCLKYHRT